MHDSLETNEDDMYCETNDDNIVDGAHHTAPATRHQANTANQHTVANPTRIVTFPYPLQTPVRCPKHLRTDMPIIIANWAHDTSQSRVIWFDCDSSFADRRYKHAMPA